MIDIKLVRKDYDWVKSKLLSKKVPLSTIKKLKELDQKLQQLKNVEEKLNAERNKLAKRISNSYTLNKQDQAQSIQERIKKIKNQLNDNDVVLKETQLAFNNLVATIPNFPDDSVPLGEDEKANKVIFEWSKPPVFDFVPKSHWELAENLCLVDFYLGPKISGTRFVVYTGVGAQLYDALARFSVDLQKKQGYYEYHLPVIVDGKSLFNTGQLPKFKDDLFALANNKYLSSTAEVQLVNLFANEILDSKKLPLKICANTLCFRKEAGAAGKDTRGIIRLHQFRKTELVILCQPTQSWQYLEQITENARAVLEVLQLPYQQIALCSGDLGFSAAKTYDLEVWLPAENKYREISSCSNTLDFQARRGMIRHRENNLTKAEYAHILNASGVAIDRLFAAVLENYQQKDGSVNIPDALKKYMDGCEKITPPKK